jgi:hypothetical protein
MLKISHLYINSGDLLEFFSINVGSHFTIMSKTSQFFQFFSSSCFSTTLIFIVLIFFKSSKTKTGLIYEINPMKDSWSVVCIVHIWFILDVFVHDKDMHFYAFVIFILLL